MGKKRVGRSAGQPSLLSFFSPAQHKPARPQRVCATGKRKREDGDDDPLDANEVTSVGTSRTRAPKEPRLAQDLPKQQPIEICDEEGGEEKGTNVCERNEHDPKADNAEPPQPPQQPEKPQQPPPPEEPQPDPGTLRSEPGNGQREERDNGESEGEESDEGGEGDCAGVPVSDYEQRRQSNLKRNAEVLRALNLELPGAPRQQRKPGTVRKQARLSLPPTRRSTRTRSLGGQAVPAEGAIAPESLPQLLSPSPPPPLEYFESSLKRFDSDCWASDWGEHDGATPVGIAQAKGGGIGSPELSDELLKRIYALHLHPTRKLCVAGGKGGRVAVFGFGDAPAAPLMSFKAHGGWVSGCAFVGVCNNGLLTSSNDGTLTLWDLNLERSAGHSTIPKLVSTSKDLHSGGVFGMHVLATSVATASKDGTVAISVLSDRGLQRRSVVEKHSAVVKCAELRDSDTVASCGNDLDVHVSDLREPGQGGGGAVIKEAHELAINHVTWRPNHAHQLMSAAFDSKIKLWDLRKPCAPVHTMVAHGQATHRSNAIHKPSFYCHGRLVLASGHKSHFVTVLDVESGAALSRWDAGGEPTQIARRGGDDELVAAVACGQCVTLVGPLWE